MPTAARIRPRTPSYGFRLRFHLPPGRTFEGVHPRRRLHLHQVDGLVYLVKLPQPKRHRFGAPMRYALLGKRFESHGAALECGTKLKRALALFAADRRIGLDVGSDRASSGVSRAIKDALAAQHGVQLRDDVHGLDVYCEQPPVRRFRMEGYGSVKHIINEYEAALGAFYQSQVPFTPKQQLAVDLYNLSHFEHVPRSRFVTLVTVVEVLATRAKRSPSARAVLDELISTVRLSALTVDERNRLCGGIGNLKRESIGGACQDFVARYATRDDVTFFARCYDARSDLVHDGKTARPEATDSTKLDELVARLLVASLTAVALPVQDAAGKRGQSNNAD